MAKESLEKLRTVCVMITCIVGTMAFVAVTFGGVRQYGKLEQKAEYLEKDIVCVRDETNASIKELSSTLSKFSDALSLVQSEQQFLKGQVSSDLMHLRAGLLEANRGLAAVNEKLDDLVRVD